MGGIKDGVKPFLRVPQHLLFGVRGWVVLVTEMPWVSFSGAVKLERASFQFRRWCPGGASPERPRLPRVPRSLRGVREGGRRLITRSQEFSLKKTTRRWITRALSLFHCCHFLPPPEPLLYSFPPCKLSPKDIKY